MFIKKNLLKKWISLLTISILIDFYNFAPAHQIYDSDYEDYFQNALENPEQYYNLFSDPESESDDLLSSIEFGDPKMFMSSLWNRNRYPFKTASKKKKSKTKKKPKTSKKRSKRQI